MSKHTINVSSLRTSYMWMDHDIPLEKSHIENERISNVGQWRTMTDNNDDGRQSMKDAISLGQVINPRFNKLLSHRSLKISPDPVDLNQQKMLKRLTDVSMSHLQFSPNIATNSVNKSMKPRSSTMSSITVEEKFTSRIDRKVRNIWNERRDRTMTWGYLLACVLCIALIVVPITLVFGLPTKVTIIIDTNIATLRQTTITISTSVTTTTTTTTETTTTTTTTETTTTTTTTVRPMNIITQAGDIIVGLYDTIAGGSTGASNGMYSTSAEYPPKAIDRNTGTKYLNYGSAGGPTSYNYQAGIDTGFYVTPSISNISVACSLLFATGNDSPERDPITVTLEGSNASGTGALDLGSSWTLIYNGSTGIDPINDPGRSVFASQQNFSNTIAYMSYRLLVTSKRNISNAVQYSEVEIIGYF